MYECMHVDSGNEKEISNISNPYKDVFQLDWRRKNLGKQQTKNIEKKFNLCSYL